MEPYSPEEFLQGFLEEADEHLRSIHQNLLLIEEAEEWRRAELVADLLRSFHTLKGLSGMVGLKEASLLSHALESVLQGVKKQQIAITQSLVDRLFTGVRVLEQVIATMRSSEHSMPDAEREANELEQLALDAGAGAPGHMQETAPSTQPVQQAQPVEGEKMLPGLSAYPDMFTALSDIEWQKLAHAARDGQFFALVVFAPSPERAEKGENVDLLRQQLAEAGSIIKAIPVMAEGHFRFQFLVAAPQAIDQALTIADEVVPLAAVKPQEQRPSEAREENRSARSNDVVRVSLERLDELMRATGELVTLRSHLGDELARLDGIPRSLKRELSETEKNLGRALRGLRQAILHARMVRLGEVFHQMPLVARDLARQSEKDVRVVIHGSEIEVDKLLVERLLDPLIHLVRNAITHGIENPDERLAAGKPRQGTLTLSGSQQGERIVIEVADDGRGIDLRKVASQAGLGDGIEFHSGQALDWILRPGFTTMSEADLAAGRGIGLDVVARMVRSFGGSIDMTTAPGTGTTFRLEMPLTLAIQDLLFVEIHSETYAIPRNAVERIIEVDPNLITRTESSEVYPVGEMLYVVHRMEKMLDVKAAAQVERQKAPKNLHGLLVLSVGDAKTARNMLLADRVRGLREAVVQPVMDPLVALPGIGGAADMGNGQLVLVLDVPELMRWARKEPVS